MSKLAKINKKPLRTGSKEKVKAEPTADSNLQITFLFLISKNFKGTAPLP